MWLLFVPVVILLIVAATAAGVFWMLGAGWPWLLIGLGVWMLWHEDGRFRRRMPSDRMVAPESARGYAPAERKPSRKAGRQLSKPELPIDLQVKVEQIRRKVDVLLGYADRFPPFSHDLYLVRQTAEEYLPRTVGAFVALPPERVDAPVVPGGQTARQELKAQLELLDARLDDIAQDLQRQDTDRLLANRRFLEERFGLRQAPSTQATPQPEPATGAA